MTFKFILDSPLKVKFFIPQNLKFVFKKPTFHITLQNPDHRLLKPKLKLESNSLNGYYKLFDQIKKIDEYYPLFNIFQSPELEFGFLKNSFEPILNLQIIYDRIQTCSYIIVDEIVKDTFYFLDTLYSQLVHSNFNQILIRNLCFCLKNDIENAISHYRIKNQNNILFETLKDLQKFSKLELPQIKSLSTSTYNYEKIAQTLNSLDSKQKTFAEWIIKNNFPRIPYYKREIDLKDLPYNAIDALIEHFKIE